MIDTKGTMSPLKLSPFVAPIRIPRRLTRMEGFFSFVIIVFHYLTGFYEIGSI
jgi:hypothetical protein